MFESPLTGRPAPRLARGATRTAARLLERSGVLKLRFQQQRALRILCYHGICADEHADAPWLPDSFVTAAQFARQIELLQRFGPVVHLGALGAAAIPREPAFAITFDDVAACTFRYAVPMLARLGLRATFFVSSGHVAAGRLFPADLLRLVRWRAAELDDALRARLAPLCKNPRAHKHMPREVLAPLLARAADALLPGLPPEVRETLRPLDWDEVTALADAGHEIGGHTVDHAILGAQPPEERRRQIVEDVSELRRRLQRPCPLFAYPNGGPGDFGPADAAVLAELGVQYAFTTRPGFATPDCDRFAVPRVCIGHGHAAENFALELAGMLDGRHRKQQGWD